MNLAEMLAMADQATANVEVSAGNGFDPLPPGEYQVAVTAAALKDSKRANPSNPAEFGKLIEIEFTITDGQYNSRKVWMRNNVIVYPKSMSEQDISNAQKAMKIGANERGVLFASLGKSSITQAEELVGASCRIKTANRPWDGKVMTEVKSVMPLSGGSSAPIPANVSPASPAPAPAAAPSRAKMPWEK